VETGTRRANGRVAITSTYIPVFATVIRKRHQRRGQTPAFARPQSTRWKLKWQVVAIDLRAGRKFSALVNQKLAPLFRRCTAMPLLSRVARGLAALARHITKDTDVLLPRPTIIWT